MKGLPVIAITQTRTIPFSAVSKAAEFFHVSPYRILTCCFCNEPIEDGTYFDFPYGVVTDEDERLARDSWQHSRKTSKTRRIVRHGKPKKEL